jgi:hypothetical protein
MQAVKVFVLTTMNKPLKTEAQMWAHTQAHSNIFIRLVGYVSKNKVSLNLIF